MVKHYIIWKLKEEITDKETRKREIKDALEGLVGKIDGLLSMTIHTEGFASSTGDLMMDSAFDSKESLDGYKNHPLHLAVANELVRPSVEKRLAFDLEC